MIVFAFAITISPDPLTLGIMLIGSFVAIMIIDIPLGFLVVMVISYIGIGVIWWIGTKLGGKAEFRKFYGVIMPVVSMITGMCLLLPILIVVFTITSMNNFLSYDDIGPFRKGMLTYLLCVFTLELIALMYLSFFAEHAHRISLGKAFISCLIPMSLPITSIFLEIIFFNSIFPPV